MEHRDQPIGGARRHADVTEGGAARTAANGDAPGAHSTPYRTAHTPEISVYGTTALVGCAVRTAANGDAPGAHSTPYRTAHAPEISVYGTTALVGCAVRTSRLHEPAAPLQKPVTSQRWHATCWWQTLGPETRALLSPDCRRKATVQAGPTWPAQLLRASKKPPVPNCRCRVDRAVSTAP